jgi:hypothetical protein
MESGYLENSDRRDADGEGCIIQGGNLTKRTGINSPLRFSMEKRED